jgi:hypothetical protein
VEGDSNLTYDGTDLILAGGNINVDTGKGIDFSATSDASGMTSELLDDYEEGTFTPTLLAGGSSLGTLNTAFGGYTKIGNRVYINIRLYSLTKNSQTGQITIGGLPFNCAGGQNYTALASWPYDGVSTTGSLILRTELNSAEIMVQSTTDAGVGSSLTNSNISSSLNFIMGGNYISA